jgi:hypothetical protein
LKNKILNFETKLITSKLKILESLVAILISHRY